MKILDRLHVASIVLIASACLSSSFTYGSANEKSEPQLAIKSLDRSVVFRRTELLSRKDAVTLQIDDPSYSGRKMTYTAVPVHALFEQVTVPESSMIQFQCLDGFSAPISKERLLNRSKVGAIAYLAIEKEGEQWPAVNPLSNSPKTPAPFYIIWVNPKLSKIGREEWPYQLSGFEVKSSPQITYASLVPGKEFAEGHPVKRGFKIFTKNCFTCHTMNLQGEATLGPDLNIPMNPTEYFSTAALRTLIRNPQDLRNWPNSKMKGFSKEEIPDSDLDDLIVYLIHMTTKKVKHKKHK